MKYERLTTRTKHGEIQQLTSRANILDRLAELEDKIESGRLIELPCIREVKGANYVRYNIYFIRNTTPDIGAIDFYTIKDKAEAEERLKVLQGE